MPVFLPVRLRRVAASTLPTVVAQGKAGFPAEEPREMAGIGVALVKADS